LISVWINYDFFFHFLKREISYKLSLLKKKFFYLFSQLDFFSKLLEGRITIQKLKSDHRYIDIWIFYDFILTFWTKNIFCRFLTFLLLWTTFFLLFSRQEFHWSRYSCKLPCWNWNQINDRSVFELIMIFLKGNILQFIFYEEIFVIIIFSTWFFSRLLEGHITILELKSDHRSINICIDYNFLLL
jgi:hypothetical protein